MKKSMMFLTYVLMGYSVTMFCAASASSRPSAPDPKAAGYFVYINRDSLDRACFDLAIIAAVNNKDCDRDMMQVGTEYAANLWHNEQVREPHAHHDIEIHSKIVTIGKAKTPERQPVLLTTIAASIMVHRAQYPQVAQFINQNIGKCVLPMRGKIEAEDIVAAIRPVLLGALALKATLAPASNEKNNYGFEPDVMDSIINVSAELEKLKASYVQDMALFEQYKQKVLCARDVNLSLSEAALREIDMFEKMRASLHESEKADKGLWFTMLFRANNHNTEQMVAICDQIREQKDQLFTKVRDVMALHDDLVANYDSDTLDENMCNVAHDALLDAQKEIALFHEKLRTLYRSVIHATR